jgi:hypothetical protein
MKTKLMSKTQKAILVIALKAKEDPKCKFTSLAHLLSEDFLGFTHFCDKSRRDKFKLGRKTSRKKFVQKMKDMNIWLKRIRNLTELKEWWKVLGVKLLGHYRYYGMNGNIRWLQNFYYQTVKLAFKWINRRSQKKSYNWDQFNRFIQFNPLPKPKIYHSLCNLNQ